MKFFRIEPIDRSWWVDYRTSGMEESISEKVESILSSNDAPNHLDVPSAAVMVGFPVHLGDETSEIALKALADAAGFEMSKRYENGDWEGYGLDVIGFSFYEQTGAATIDHENYTIDIEVANGTDPSDLVAVFALSIGASADVVATPVVSGVTSVDYTNPVTLTITNSFGDEQDWTVTVTVA